MVKRKNLIGRHPARRLVKGAPVCLDCGEAPDYLPHGSAAECEAWMKANVGRSCANPREHHPFRPRPIWPA